MDNIYFFINREYEIKFLFDYVENKLMEYIIS